MRRICRRCPRVALTGAAFCSNCASLEPPAWRTAEYLANRAMLLATSPLVCSLCGRGEVPGDPWTADHIVPRRAGGGNDIANLARAHRSCNSRRGANASNKRVPKRGTVYSGRSQR